MVWPIQFIKQFGDTIVTQPRWQAHRARGNLKGLISRFLPRVHQAEAKQPVNRPFEGVACAPLLLLHQPGNVVVNGQSGPHIMMLGRKAS